MEKIYRKKYCKLLIFVCLTVIGAGANAQAPFSFALSGLKRVAKPPMGLPVPEFPESNPYSKRKAALGERLFFDPILSKNKAISCAFCHQPQTAFTNNLDTAIGFNGAKGDVNVPVLFNRAYSKAQFWDTRAPTLEKQIIQPINNHKEMALTTTELIDRLRTHRFYKKEFNEVFRVDASEENLSMALATFIRTILSGNSSYDRFIAGDLNAISEEAKIGMRLFQDKFKCQTCHSGANFSNEKLSPRCYPLHIPESKISGVFPFRFKTPTLRNLNKSSPYLHNGSLKTIAEVIEFYQNTGPVPNGFEERIDFPEIVLSDKDRKALKAFLESLNGEIVIYAPPNAP